MLIILFAGNLLENFYETNLLAYKIKCEKGLSNLRQVVRVQNEMA